MIVVADTSPLNYLIRIDHDSLLQVLFKRVIVPEIVLVELAHRNAPPMVQEWMSHVPWWIEPRRPNPSDDQDLAHLDQGEREAILLAVELTADLLLIDEKKGRAEAARRRLSATGTLGVLQLASKRGLVNAPEIYRRLVSETNFHTSPQLERDFLRSVGYR